MERWLVLDAAKMPTALLTRLITKLGILEDRQVDTRAARGSASRCSTFRSVSGTKGGASHERLEPVRASFGAVELRSERGAPARRGDRARQAGIREVAAPGDHDTLK
jgi:hypothetical protein